MRTNHETTPAPCTPTDEPPLHDVLIVGAGPAGLALATALGRAGFQVLVLEQQPLAGLGEPPEDGRDIALTHRSRRLLEQLGCWARLPAAETAPLQRAVVRNGQSPWVLPFDTATRQANARGTANAPLGWLVPNHRLRAAAWAQALATPGVQLCGQRAVVALEAGPTQATVTTAQGERHHARLVVAADSRFSTLRRWAGIGAESLDFGRTAIVARIAHSLPHGQTAQECFAFGHTLAMLPMAGSHSSAVLTVPSPQAPAWLALDDAAFAARLQNLFGAQLGLLQAAGQRHAYPLVAVYAQRFHAQRFALVGDAAVGMHPVTAHGFNFGLYGVEALTDALVQARRQGQDIGCDRVLAGYGRTHWRTTRPIYLGTNALVRLFTDDRPPARLLREAVMQTSRRLPPLRAWIARQLTGDAGPLQQG